MNSAIGRAWPEERLGHSKTAVAARLGKHVVRSVFDRIASEFVIVERYATTPNYVACYSKEQALLFAAEPKSTMVTAQLVMGKASAE